MKQHRFIKFCIASYLKTVNFFRGKTKMPKNHLDKFQLPIDEFNDLINKYPYKWDPLKGLIDIVGEPDKFFDKDKKYNRDCDNFANVICVNGILNGYKADEWVVTDAENIKSLFGRMHVVAILEKDGEYILGNYRLYKGFESIEEVLDYLDFGYSDMIAVHSREVKLKK